MPGTSALFHFLGALRNAVARVILFFIVFLIIGAALIEGLAYIVGRSSSGAYSPALITHITAAITGIILGYAAAFTVIAAEAIQALIGAIRDVEKDVEKGVASGASGGNKILEPVLQRISGKR
jgi:hypothetical protein